MQTQRISVAGGAVVAALAVFGAVYCASPPSARGFRTPPVRVTERTPRAQQRVFVKVTERQRVGLGTYLAQLPDGGLPPSLQEADQDRARRARQWRKAQRLRTLEKQREQRELQQKLQEERELQELLEAAERDGKERREIMPADDAAQTAADDGGPSPDAVKSPETGDGKTRQPEQVKPPTGEKRPDSQDTET